jgi:hypothetical protein
MCFVVQIRILWQSEPTVETVVSVRWRSNFYVRRRQRTDSSKRTIETVKNVRLKKYLSYKKLGNIDLLQ